ncbi:hypothetical protein DAETH_28710 [Deinococcus aetherius]|uniref:Uncharacterized protein n=1 Tax=Deinococcus aetherius TaxID=200252 RepID=A0ABN6RHS2_9DEIO|nr:hypothetical protein [Deinococcus aetherius]BDP42902.1 hypothetical protein DAETH_28710 [Deinococcus aetherius]
MSARTGRRRALLLLALYHQGQTVSRLSANTGLRYTAVEGILDSLSRSGLAELSEAGWVIGSGPHVAAALEEAREIVRGVGA